MEKKLDSNYTRMLHAILNKYWRQHPTNQQLYGHLPPITKTMKVKRTRPAEHCWRSRDELIIDYSYGPLHMAEQRQGDQLAPTHSSTVGIRGVALNTRRKRWTIGRVGEKGLGISMLMTWQNDDDDDDTYIHSYICVELQMIPYRINWLKKNSEFQ